MSVACHDAILVLPDLPHIVGHFYNRILEEATAAAGFNYLHGYTEGGSDFVLCGGPVDALPLLVPRECLLLLFPFPRDLCVLSRYTTFTTSSHRLSSVHFPLSPVTSPYCSTTHSSHNSLLCIVTPPLTTLIWKTNNTLHLGVTV